VDGQPDDDEGHDDCCLGSDRTEQTRHGGVGEREQYRTGLAIAEPAPVTIACRVRFSAR
jgi:hypothetical protein